MRNQTHSTTTLNPVNIMKSKFIITTALAAMALASCDKQKAAVEAKADATKDSLNLDKEAVNAAADAAKKRTDVNAKIDKANIEADQASDQAQLDANKKKADAEATAEKARIDALRK
jgi:hypothetical protein